ncbi:MAG: hypothetical protein FWE50_03025 [Alphaproteobacteria bacterium]|nr:hypothetical protein [Alphaproteobacteria bacterium]
MGSGIAKLHRKARKGIHPINGGRRKKNNGNNLGTVSVNTTQPYKTQHYSCASMNIVNKHIIQITFTTDKYEETVVETRYNRADRFNKGYGIRQL